MVSSSKLKLVINFILFQAIWFAAVIGAAKSNLWWCYGLFAIFLTWQLLPANRKAGDCLNVIVLLVLGLLIDSTWVYTGLIEYRSHISWYNSAPNWILILWVSFALSLNHSMSWIYAKPNLAYWFGFIGGPLSYFAGERLGAIKINTPWLTTLCLAFAWLAVIWVIVKLRKENYTNIFQFFLGKKTHA